MYADHGYIINHLEDLLIEKGLSKNKFCHMAELERTQLNNLCKNKTTRLDTDVLSRICHALNCNINDLLEYIPPEPFASHIDNDYSCQASTATKAADVSNEYLS